MVLGHAHAIAMADERFQHDRATRAAGAKFAEPCGFECRKRVITAVLPG